MKCIACNNEFIIKRKIKDLLVKQKYLVCNKCFYEHINNINLLALPLDNKRLCYIVEILNENDKVNMNAFLLEYSRVVEKLISKYLILMDNLTIFKNKIEELDIISNLIDDDIFVICFRCRIV